MKNIIFADDKTIKQPKGALIVEKPQEQDHILGGEAGEDFDILMENGQWLDERPEPELQRNNKGDTFMCVTYSLNNIHEYIYKKRYDEIINFSDIFVGVGSGTIRGRGNSKRTVAEWKRTHGWVKEGDYPYLDDMTLDEVYKPLTSALLKKGLEGLDLATTRYKWVGDNSATAIKAGLKHSPVQVDVQQYNIKNGIVYWNSVSQAYIHEVAIVGYVDGKYWIIEDSENEQYLKYAWNYPFGSPMIHCIKKTMKIEILKKKGHSALCVKTYDEPSLIAFSGGDITAETLFKSVYGIRGWNEVPIKEVDEWPFPIKHIFNSNPYRGN
uniref:Putative peptidase n=1 Tax=viral metagenome TaxID=1070528 RepID=A0A6H1ZC94_9ZZZZ